MSGSVHSLSGMGDPELTEELALRLADVQAVIASIDPEAAERVDEEAAGFLSALDYALRGESGCWEREEWQDMRRQALAKHGDYLGLGKSNSGVVER